MTRFGFNIKGLICHKTKPTKPNLSISIIRILLTQDEAWIYNLGPESKIQSKQRKDLCSLLPMKFKLAESVGKKMSFVLGDSKSIIMINYLEKEKKLLIESNMNHH